MNAVGIDVSKGKSTVTVLQPFGVVIAEPFEVMHTADELKKLVLRMFFQYLCCKNNKLQLNGAVAAKSIRFLPIRYWTICCSLA